MKRAWLVAVAAASLSLAVACKKASKPRAAVVNADGAVAVDAGAPAPDAADTDAAPLTPPIPSGKVGIQVLGLEYEGHEAKMLPAIRADGAQIAAMWVGDDGGRGYLDLKLQIVDVKTGKIVDDRRLVDPEETTATQGDDGSFDPKVLEAVKQRVADANALFAAATWRSMVSHAGDPGDPEAPIVAAGINWSLDDKRHLIGTRAGQTVFDRKYTQMTGKLGPRDHVPDEMCPEIITLSAIHVDEPSSQALVAFGRQPGHNCGAPGDDLAVITLPK